LLASTLLRQLMVVVAVLIFAFGFALDNDLAGLDVQLAWAIATTFAVVLYIFAGSASSVREDTAKHVSSLEADDQSAAPPFVNMALAMPPFVFVGRISYQVYLWHWPTILFSRKLWTLLTYRSPEYGHAYVASTGSACVAVSCFALGMGVALPIVSFKVLEAPVRAWRPASHSYAIVTMLSLIGICVGTVALMKGPLGEAIALGMAPTHLCEEAMPRESFYPYLRDGTGNLSIPTAYGRSTAAGCACRHCGGMLDDPMPAFGNDSDVKLCNTAYPRNLAMFNQDSLYDLPPCSLRTGDRFVFADFISNIDESKAAITRCLEPDRSSKDLPRRTMFFIGDSLGSSMYAGLAYAVRGRYQLRTFRIHEPVGVLSFTTGIGMDHLHDRAVMLDVVHYMYDQVKAFMQPDDVLVILQKASSFSEMVRHESSGRFVEPERPMMHRFFAEVFEDIVRPANASLIVFDHWPTIERTGLDWWPNTEGTGMFNISDQLALQRNIEPYVAEAAGAHFISVLPHFCNGELHENALVNCSRHVPGTQVMAYVDEWHLNTAGSISLWPFLCNAISNAGL